MYYIDCSGDPFNKEKPIKVKGCLERAIRRAIKIAGKHDSYQLDVFEDDPDCNPFNGSLRSRVCDGDVLHFNSHLGWANNKQTIEEWNAANKRKEGSK